MFRSRPTSSAPSDAAAPVYALVPALITSTSCSPRSIAILRAMPSARALRQVLPVQTNRIFMRESSPLLAPGLRVPDQVRYTFAQHRRGDGTGPDDAGAAASAVHHRGRRRWHERSAVEHPQLAGGNGVAPL